MTRATTGLSNVGGTKTGTLSTGFKLSSRVNGVTTVALICVLDSKVCCGMSVELFTCES